MKASQIKMETTKESKKRIRIPFTDEEDKIINNFVKLTGGKNWIFIAHFVPGRTAKQCRDRYTNYLKPGLINNEWTEKDDELLIELYSRYGSKWAIMNKYFQNRNQVSLKNRLVFLQNQNDPNKKNYLKKIKIIPLSIHQFQMNQR